MASTVSPMIRAAISAAEQKSPLGICACGCGQCTSISTYGPDKGQPKKWVKGHWHKFRRSFFGADYKSYHQRQSERDKIRKEMADHLYFNRFISRDDIYTKFAGRGFEKCALGVILKSAIDDFSYRCNEDELGMPKRKEPPKAPPPYERTFIPHERETEIPLLVLQRKFMALDSPFLDGKKTRHEIIGLSHVGYGEGAIGIDFNDPAKICMAKDDWLDECRQAYPIILKRPDDLEILPDGFGFAHD